MSIVGPTGPTGPQGPQGERGRNGRMGLDGPTGPAGSSGGGASLTVLDNPSAIINNTYTIASGSTSSNTYLKDCVITTGLNRVYTSFVPGLDNTCYAIVSSGTDLYVGGDFTTAGGISANRIAKYNTVTGVWSALGSGLDLPGSSCRAIAVSGSNVYVGGDFASAGGVSVNNIAKWDGSSWSALASGVSNVCLSLAISGTDLYAGGVFGNASGVSGTSKIAKWDGSSWSALGTGLNDQCVTLAVSGSNLYAGGAFTLANGNTANKIAVWNGTTWSTLGDGFDNQCRSIGFIGSDLYACGFFTNSGSTPINQVAKWNGTAWSALGAGIDGGNPYVLTTLGTDLYVGGFITSAGGVSVNNIAKWNTLTSTWSALGNGLNDGPWGLTSVGTELYIGGQFTSVGNNISSNRITSYTFNYINLVFNSQIVSTLYNNSSGSQVNTYLSGATTYASVTNNIPFYQ